MDIVLQNLRNFSSEFVASSNQRLNWILLLLLKRLWVLNSSQLLIIKRIWKLSWRLWLLGIMTWVLISKLSWSFWINPRLWDLEPSFILLFQTLSKVFGNLTIYLLDFVIFFFSIFLISLFLMFLLMTKKGVRKVGV